MSESPSEPTAIDLKTWIDQAVNDPTKHHQRQITAIILNAISLVDSFRGNLVLKGGTLLAIAHGSQRQTSDIDFTARADPEAFAVNFIDVMNRGLDRARARLGYTQWRCRIQGKLNLQPRNFSADSFPAIETKIAYALAGSRDERHLDAGTCTHVLEMEITFREPMIETEEITLLASNATIEVYSINEVIAEKFRAYLQQTIRRRRRRQDIYDIAYLIRHEGEDIDHSLVHQALLEKCAARNVPVDPGRLDDPDLMARAKAEWNTMTLEVGELPPFEECFAVVRELYHSLPWDTALESSRSIR
jgi:predicted nucleotidyltransferase component of viral defense system